MDNILFNYLNNTFSSDMQGEHFDAPNKLTLGTVVDTGDPLQNGRLRIFCAALGDNPKKINMLPWAIYITPYGGVIDNNEYARGDYNETPTTDGGVAYGFWGIPELGAQVLVGCVDGDVRRRFWIGCVYNHQEVQTIFSGRFFYSKGSADGPFSSGGQPIQPMYDNMKTAFSGTTTRPEWQSRGVDYQTAAVLKSNGGPPNSDKSSYLDDGFPQIQGSQQFPWVADIVGNNGYDWSGFKTISGIKSSRVAGLSTPGFHSISLDDRPYNCRIKLKTTSGHMILMDDTNERMYLTTNKGKSYIEMDSCGNIDIFAADRLSIHSQQDINFSADQSIRLTAGVGIYMYSGPLSGLPALNNNPNVGEIRIQAMDDLNIISNNLRSLSFLDTIFEIGADECITIGGKQNTQAESDINIISNTGNYNANAIGEINLMSGSTMGLFSIGGTTISSQGNINEVSLTGSLYYGAYQSILQKSITGSINIEVDGNNSNGSASVNIRAPNSQMILSNAGTSLTTNGNLSLGSAGEMSVQAGVPTQQSPPIPNFSSVTNNCNMPPTIPITGLHGAQLAARCAYNAGFRGSSWVIATAIAGAESSYNPENVGDQALAGTPSECGGGYLGSYGFWQIFCLANPTQCPYPDSLRSSTECLNPQYCRNVAYALSNNGTNFNPWSTYKFNKYQAYIGERETAIQSLCSANSTQSLYFMENISTDSLILSLSPGIGSGIIISAESLNIQSATDIGLITSASSYGVSTTFASYIDTIASPTINMLIAEVSQLGGAVGIALRAISAIEGLADAGLSNIYPTILSGADVYLPENIDSILNMSFRA
jgi:uncharacterized protein (DUF2345 family)